MNMICIKWIKKHILSIAICLFGLMFTQTVFADAADIQFGGGLMYFDYAEYRDNNEFLDGETGLMPGIIIKRKQRHQRLFTELVGQLYGNKIKYDGQTQDEVPLTTDSIAIIFDGHIKVGMRIAQKHEPYIGLGYRYWYRHILNGYDITGGAVSGLLEEYKWFYGILGYAANFAVSEDVSVGYDFRYTKMMSAKMDIDHLGYCGYDDAQVNLGNESGARFSLPVKVKTRSHVLTVTPYYEIIDIGKSNIIALTRNGNLVDCKLDGFYDGALEPRSETRNVGIELTWLW